MFELIAVGAAIFFGGIYLFKSLLFFLGLLLTSVGFILKAVITVVSVFILFPITLVLTGGILSSGIIVLILICSLLGALSYRRVQENHDY